MFEHKNETIMCCHRRLRMLSEDQHIFRMNSAVKRAALLRCIRRCERPIHAVFGEASVFACDTSINVNTDVEIYSV